MTDDRITSETVARAQSLLLRDEIVQKTLAGFLAHAIYEETDKQVFLAPQRIKTLLEQFCKASELIPRAADIVNKIRGDQQ